MIMQTEHPKNCVMLGSHLCSSASHVSYGSPLSVTVLGEFYQPFVTSEEGPGSDTMFTTHIMTGVPRVGSAALGKTIGFIHPWHYCKYKLTLLNSIGFYSGLLALHFPLPLSIHVTSYILFNEYKGFCDWTRGDCDFYLFLLFHCSSIHRMPYMYAVCPCVFLYSTCLCHMCICTAVHIHAFNCCVSR